MKRTDEMVLKFREVLKETERFSSSEMEASQRKLLTPLLLHARAHAPFYWDRLDAIFNGDQIDFERWHEIPIASRTIVQEDEKALHAARVSPHLGKAKASETSGSKGLPLQFLTKELMDVAALAMTDRLYRWWDFDGSKPMINFVPPRLKLKNPAQTITDGWCSGHLEGLNIMRHSERDIDGHLDWLLGKRPIYLVSYPSLYRALAQRALERGIKLNIENVITRGWVVSVETWDLCRQAFNAPLIDQYGASEIGQVACQCPHRGDYHINSEGVLVEVLDKIGEPVTPGETGRVVLTAFYNYAMPFIRYEVGDFARVAPDDKDCRTKLHRLRRIAGRYRNNFTLRDGRVIFPNPPMNGFGKFSAYSQIQVVQTDYDELEVRYFPRDGSIQNDEAGLQRWLRQELDADFTVRLVPVSDIPALPSGKYEDFVSLVGPRAPLDG